MIIRHVRKYRVRCRKCRARAVLSQHPNDYSRPRRCHSCGNQEWTIDAYRDSKREAKRQTCDCDGLTFPHRRGSLGCYHYVRPIPEPDDFIELYHDGDEAPF